MKIMYYNKGVQLFAFAHNILQLRRRRLSVRSRRECTKRLSDQSFALGKGTRAPHLEGRA